MPADRNRSPVSKSLARVWQQQHVSDDEVRKITFRFDYASLKGIVSLRRLGWLSHVLRMSIQRLPHCALFTLVGQE